jgi:hypothetical protein
MVWETLISAEIERPTIISAAAMTNSRPFTAEEIAGAVITAIGPGVVTTPTPLAYMMTACQQSCVYSATDMAWVEGLRLNSIYKPEPDQLILRRILEFRGLPPANNQFDEERTEVVMQPRIVDQKLYIEQAAATAWDEERKESLEERLASAASAVVTFGPKGNVTTRPQAAMKGFQSAVRVKEEEQAVEEADSNERSEVELDIYQGLERMAISPFDSEEFKYLSKYVINPFEEPERGVEYCHGGAFLASGKGNLSSDSEGRSHKKQRVEPVDLYENQKTMEELKEELRRIDKLKSSLRQTVMYEESATDTEDELQQPKKKKGERRTSPRVMRIVDKTRLRVLCQFSNGSRRWKSLRRVKKASEPATWKKWMAMLVQELQQLYRDGFDGPYLSGSMLGYKTRGMEYTRTNGESITTAALGHEQWQKTKFL